MTNWREYERGVRSRRNITVWFSDEARYAWTPPKNGRGGGQPRYSNLAIVTALSYDGLPSAPATDRGISGLIVAVDINVLLEQWEPIAKAGAFEMYTPGR